MIIILTILATFVWLCIGIVMISYIFKYDWSKRAIMNAISGLTSLLLWPIFGLMLVIKHFITHSEKEGS